MKLIKHKQYTEKYLNSEKQTRAKDGDAKLEV